MERILLALLTDLIPLILYGIGTTPSDPETVRCLRSLERMRESLAKGCREALAPVKHPHAFILADPAKKGGE